MPQNIGDNRIVTTEIARITLRDAERLSRYRVRAGDIVYSRRGDVERRALVRAAEDGWLCGTGCLRLRVGTGSLDPGFTSFYLGHPEVRGWIVRHAIGATMPNLNTSILSALPTVIPPPEEQQEIATLLGALDDKIELNRRTNETLEAITQTIFRSWFVDLAYISHASGGLSQPRTTICRKMPEGWTVSSLAALFPTSPDCVTTGPFGSNLHASDYRKEGVPLILCQHIVDGQISGDAPSVGMHKAEELSRYRVRIGDIVLTRVGMRIGRSAFVQASHAGWLISGQLLRVRVSAEGQLNSRYLAQSYLQPEFVAMVEGQALGSTRPSLNTKIVKSFEFLLPPIEAQRRFASLANSIDAKIQSNLVESSALTELRDTLLPKLMSGQVRVNHSMDEDRHRITEFEPMV